MKKLYLKSALLLVLTVLVGLTSCKKDEFEKLSLSFSSSSVDIDENGYIGLKKYLVIQPSNLDTITVAWSSSDESVAIVSKNGSVEGVSIGNAVITASAYGKSATIKVNVTPLPIEDVTVPEKVDDIFVNVPYKLDGVGLTPSGASLKRINWSDETGKLTFEYNEEENAWYVTATEAGTYNVTAKADEAEAESTFTVNVKTIESITLSETSLSLLSTGTENRTATLTYTIKPADASYQEVEWSVNPSGIINCDKGKLTTLEGKEGSVTVTVKHKAAVAGDKAVEASCKVMVTQAGAVETFSLSVSSLTVDIGKNAVINVTNVKPANGDASKIKWSVEDNTLVRLDNTTGSKCQVTGIGTTSGTTTLTAKASNGYSQSVTVKVNKVAAQLTWDMPSKIFLFGSKTYSMPVAKVNADATIKTITYSVLEGSTGTKTSSDLNLSSTGFTLAASPINPSSYKEYRIVAKCDNKEKVVKVTLLASKYLQNNLVTDEWNTNVFGTGGIHLYVSTSEYFNRSIPSTIADSIWFTPDKSYYNALESKTTYYPSERYHSMSYTFRCLSTNSDSRNKMNITATIFDYNRNSQTVTFAINVRNTLLGYRYRVYKNGSSSPTKTGTQKSGETITVNYTQSLSKYIAPVVIYDLIYYSDNDNTKDYEEWGYELGGETYDTSEERLKNLSFPSGEKVYVKFKK